MIKGRVLSGYTASVSDFRFSETRVRVEILQFIKKKTLHNITE